ncbi:MAG TPA: hypothetical protein VEK09_00255 [Jatrophihabitantaceae bacterium]|nr:hypothetical protein [Jatrophihabitantaceae bacterium]
MRITLSRAVSAGLLASLALASAGCDGDAKSSTAATGAATTPAATSPGTAPSQDTTAAVPSSPPAATAGTSDPSVSATSQRQLDAAAVMVQKFYREYTREDLDPEASKRLRARYLTKQARAEVDKTVGYDTVVCAQDVPGAVSLEGGRLRAADASTAVGRVRETFGQKAVFVEVTVSLAQQRIGHFDCA